MKDDSEESEIRCVALATNDARSEFLLRLTCLPSGNVFELCDYDAKLALQNVKVTNYGGAAFGFADGCSLCRS